ncbi:co-chaperone GroES [Candidatus Parcubacteria bacterium]|nr:co-chaperone GroES [Candidatus Parcubacteria bacterium]
MKKTAKSSKKFKVMPLGDRVLVRPFEEGEKDKTKSGIFIPDSVQKEKSGEGEVVAVGEGHYDDGKLIPVRVKVGDTVMFSKYGYDEIKVDGKEYYILKEDSILAIIR